VIKKAFLFSIFSLTLLFTTSCATSQSQTDQHEHEDTLESFNRAMFTFNYNVDKYVLKPVAKGYRAITTPDVRTRVYSAYLNIKEPMFAANQLLQGEFKQSGISLSRFVINSTLGLAGTFDVATAWGLEQKKDDFETTLAKWCVPDGPYIVLPFIGPSTPRAFAGLMVDSFASPVYWLTNDHDDGIYAYGAYIAAKSIIIREASLELGDDLERNSVDFYTTMKSAYLQNKTDMPNCFNDTQTNAAYDFDFGIEDEEQTFDEMEAE